MKTYTCVEAKVTWTYICHINCALDGYEMLDSVSNCLTPGKAFLERNGGKMYGSLALPEIESVQSVSIYRTEL
jgi:hypothetical protein